MNKSWDGACVRLGRSVAAGLLVLGLAAAGVAPAQAQFVDVPGTQVMVMGDSITHGLEGDYTWRYRLWEHLSRQGVAVDFVGPWAGTNRLPAAYPPDSFDTPPVFDGAYRDHLTFPSRHFARWGWMLGFAANEVAAQVSAQHADYLLVLLGFNDLAWSLDQPDPAVAADQLIASLRQFVSNARAANPDIRILLGNVVRRTPLPEVNPGMLDRIDAYNARVGAEVDRLRTARSPIYLVDVSSTYIPTVDAYDGVHPGVSGEYKLARAFANTLSQRFGIGAPYGELPAVMPEPLRPAAPDSLYAESLPDNAVRLVWSHPFGAGGYWLWSRDVTKGEPFKRSVYAIGADSWSARKLPSGHVLEYRVETMRGHWESHQDPQAARRFSPTVRVTVPPLAPVSNVAVSIPKNRPFAVTVSWAPVAGAEDYHVYMAPKCVDFGLVPDADYQLVQYNLAGRTAWTQEYVTPTCVTYRVVAAKYGGEGPAPRAGVMAMPRQTMKVCRSSYLEWVQISASSERAGEYIVRALPSQSAQIHVPRSEEAAVWNDLYACLPYEPDNFGSRSATLNAQLRCHTRWTVARPDVQSGFVWTGGPTWDLESWRSSSADIDNPLSVIQHECNW